MHVGCPKEIKNHEYRVGLTPGAVREYVAHGHDVIVESGAGLGIGADDGAYAAAGAKVVSTIGGRCGGAALLWHIYRCGLEPSARAGRLTTSGW
mgnify:CR=1 FL=1